MQLMLQATVCDCLTFDPFAFEEDGLSAPEVDVSRRDGDLQIAASANIAMLSGLRDRPVQAGGSGAYR
jgi:hypothetical protein